MTIRLALFNFFFLIIIALTGCARSESANQENEHIPSTPTLEKILSNKKLIALINNSPSSYYIYKGEPKGYEYEMLQQFADYLNVELELKVINDIGGLLDSLQSQAGDLAAANLTITSSRQQWVDFSSPLIKTKQVLVQRLPEDYKKLTLEKRNKKMVRDVTELSGKTVHVRKGTSFEQRIKHLNEEIGGGIDIVPIPGWIESDSLLNMVSNKTIDYTLADENLALLFKGGYRNIDVKTDVSFSQNIAWAAAKESDRLLDTLNYWLSLKETKRIKSHIYNKYYKWQRKAIAKIDSPYNLSEGGQICEYDSLIKSVASKHNFDWTFLASVIHRESDFNANAVSWSGAIGLMQIIPSTSERFGTDSTQLYEPKANIEAGTAYLRYLQKYWINEIQDSVQATKLALASYNVGLGHIKDARRLAIKFNLDGNKWENNVDQMVLKLSNPEFYNDEVVKHGYCRGKEPFIYVRDIFSRYQHYQNFIS